MVIVIPKVRSQTKNSHSTPLRALKFQRLGLKWAIFSGPRFEVPSLVVFFSTTSKFEVSLFIVATKQPGLKTLLEKNIDFVASSGFYGGGVSKVAPRTVWHAFLLVFNSPWYYSVVFYKASNYHYEFRGSQCLLTEKNNAKF